MNVWSLPKHDSIKLVLLLLFENLGRDSFTVLDTHPSDNRAILLAKPNEYAIRAYLFTYGQDPDRYGVHLEMPDHTETNLSNIIEIYENLTLARLTEMLTIHFDVVPAQIKADVRYQKLS